MSNIAKFEFLKKSVTIAESQAKIEFDLTERDELNINEEILCSEKIHIPEIDGYWIIKLMSPSKDTKRWTCELLVENEELVKSNMYEACIQRIPTRRKNETQFSFGFCCVDPNYKDIIMPINDKHIIAIDSNDLKISPTYEFHIKITIGYCRASMITRKVELPKQTDTMPNWFAAAKTLIDSSDLSDFTYVVQGKEFKVHKLILSLASPVFRSTFECGLDETRDNKAIVTDCDPEMFQHLLNFIYKGTSPDNIKELALNLFKLAHVYQLQPLQNICFHHIMLTQLNQDNVMELYDAAITYDLGQLKNDCWTFIKINMMRIFTPLAGEPYSVEEVHEILDLMSTTNDKLKEMRNAIARKRPS